VCGLSALLQKSQRGARNIEDLRGRGYKRRQSTSMLESAYDLAVQVQTELREAHAFRLQNSGTADSMAMEAIKKLQKRYLQPFVCE